MGFRLKTHSTLPLPDVCDRLLPTRRQLHVDLVMVASGG